MLLCTSALLRARFPTCTNVHVQRFCVHEISCGKIVIYEGLYSELLWSAFSCIQTKYSVSLRTQSECEKMRTRITPAQPLTSHLKPRPFSNRKPEMWHLLPAGCSKLNRGDNTEKRHWGVINKYKGVFRTLSKNYDLPFLQK